MCVYTFEAHLGSHAQRCFVLDVFKPEAVAEGDADLAINPYADFAGAVFAVAQFAARLGGGLIRCSTST
jgi:hypothetical protein